MVFQNRKDKGKWRTILSYIELISEETIPYQERHKLLYYCFDWMWHELVAIYQWLQLPFNDWQTCFSESIPTFTTRFSNVH